MPRGQGGVASGSAGGTSASSESSSETITYEEAVRTGQIGRYTRGMAPETWTKEQKEEAVFIKEPIKGKVVTEEPEEAEEEKIVVARRTGGGLVTTTEREATRRFGEYEAVVTPAMVSEEGEVRGARVRTPTGWVSTLFPKRPSIRKPADSGEILIEKRIPILPKKREEFEGIPSISEGERRLTAIERESFFRRLVGKPVGEAVTKVTGSEKAGRFGKEYTTAFLSYPSAHPVKTGVLYGVGLAGAIGAPFIAGASLVTKLVLGTAMIGGSGVSGFSLGAEAKRAEEQMEKYGLETGGAGKVFGEFTSGDLLPLGVGALHGSYLTPYTTPALKSRFTKAGKLERKYMKNVFEEYGEPALGKIKPSKPLTVKELSAQYGEPLKSDVPFVGKLQPYTSPSIKQFTAEYGKSVFGKIKIPKVPPGLNLPRRVDYPRASASQRSDFLKARTFLERSTTVGYSTQGAMPKTIEKIEGKGLDKDIIKTLSKEYRIEALRSESSTLRSDLVSARNKAWTARSDLISSLEKQYTMKVVYNPNTGRTTIRPVLKPRVTQLYTPSGKPVGFTVPKPPKVPIKKIGLYEILGKPTGQQSQLVTGSRQVSAFKSVSITDVVQPVFGIKTSPVRTTPPSLKYTFIKKVPPVPKLKVPDSLKTIFPTVTTIKKAPTKTQFQIFETKQISKIGQAQELIMLQEQKLDQSQYQKVEQSLASVLGQKQRQAQAQRQDQAQAQRQKQMQQQLQAMGTPTMPRSAQALSQAQAQVQAQVQAQEEVFETPTVLITEQVEPKKPRKPRKPRQSYTDYIPTEPIPVKKPIGFFKFPDIKFPKGKPGKPLKFRVPERKLKYTPTLASDYLGVTVRKTPSKRVYRGLEIRPYISSKPEKVKKLKDIKQLI